MKRKTKTIFRHMIVPMCALVLLETGILWCCFSMGGIFSRLNQNAKDIVRQKVITRSEYLENQMRGSWANLANLTEYINTKARKLEQDGEMDFETLDQTSNNATPLLNSILNELIKTMRSLRVSGIYVIFNTQDLDLGLENKSGIYIRDGDPLSGFSSDNGDLLFECAPMAVAAESNIAKDTCWRPRFEFAKNQSDYYDFFYVPYQEAFHNEKNYSAKDMGYWGGPFVLNESGVEAITYSLPLINDEGLVYGVAGIDISLDYLKKLLPGGELMEEPLGSYLLGILPGDGLTLENVFVSDPLYRTTDQLTALKKENEDFYIVSGDRKLFAPMSHLDLYNSNTPYSDQKWVLLGLVDTMELYTLSSQVKEYFLLAVILMLFAGFAGSFMVSYVITRPVKRLSDKVEASGGQRRLQLERTNIAEIDHLAERIELLHHDMRDYGMKFTTILKMASVKMAGFEYNEDSGEIYLSDNFFEIFMDFKKTAEGISVEELKEAIEGYHKFLVSKDFDNNEFLYKIPTGDDFCYIKMKQLKNGPICTGVVENVTRTVVEKKIIEHERDYDVLTGLLNRRAYRRKMNHLFDMEPEKLKVAGLVMLDLDSLKAVNDNYGHEMGDRYIARSALCFKRNTPPGTIVSRISGDEFFIFFYGYENPDAIREQLYQIWRKLESTGIELPDGTTYPLSASGGIAWYPQDTVSFEILQQYADYAMYSAKRSGKGRLAEFNRKEYEEYSYRIEEKKELDFIIHKEAVRFFMQPIVDCRSGEVFAYEALMRPMGTKLKSPLDVLKIAKQEGKLENIEILTWFHAMETFAMRRADGSIPKNCRIFINSIASQILPEEKIRELEKRYRNIMEYVVLEVTEGELVNEEYHRTKEEFMRRWNGAVAIDDYGSGYNGNLVLLFVAPQYIKLDMEIIRGIDSNPDKSSLVENIVGYAHERNMKIIAEGVETPAELEQVIKLGADYVQGYLFARPEPVPCGIPKETSELIRTLGRRYQK